MNKMHKTRVADDRRGGGGACQRSAIAAAAVALLTLLPLLWPTAGQALDAYPADSFHRSMGVNVKIGYSDGVTDSRYATIKSRLQEVGFLYIRSKVFPNKVARLRDLYACCGIRTLVRIDYKTGDSDDYPVDPTQIPAGVDQALAIGAEAIAGFEGVNEYTRENNYPGWDVDLRNYQQVLYDEIKTVRNLPQPVIGPTVYKRSLADILTIGNIGAMVDAANYHLYNGGWEPSRNFDRWMGDSVLMAPGEPVWLTEFGYHNTLAMPDENPVSFLAAAKYLPRYSAMFFERHPGGRHLIYEFFNSGTNPYDREHHLGLMQSNFGRKPAFHAYRRLIQAVKGGLPAGELSLQPLALTFTGDMLNIRTLLLQKTASQYVLLMWQEVRSWDRTLQKNISWPRRSIVVGLPQAADVDLADTLPVAGSPAQDAPPVVLGRAATSVTVNVPDQIVAVLINLN